MRNRNKEIEIDKSMGFDYEAYDSERGFNSTECDYEYYEAEELYPFDVEVTESVKKIITVYAPSPAEARQKVKDRIVSINMDSGIDEYKKYVSGCYKRELVL